MEERGIPLAIIISSLSREYSKNKTYLDDMTEINTFKRHKNEPINSAMLRAKILIQRVNHLYDPEYWAEAKEQDMLTKILNNIVSQCIRTQINNLTSECTLQGRTISIDTLIKYVHEWEMTKRSVSGKKPNKIFNKNFPTNTDTSILNKTTNNSIKKAKHSQNIRTNVSKQANTRICTLRMTDHEAQNSEVIKTKNKRQGKRMRHPHAAKAFAKNLQLTKPNTNTQKFKPKEKAGINHMAITRPSTIDAYDDDIYDRCEHCSRYHLRHAVKCENTGYEIHNIWRPLSDGHTHGVCNQCGTIHRVARNCYKTGQSTSFRNTFDKRQYRNPTDAFCKPYNRNSYKRPARNNYRRQNLNNIGNHPPWNTQPGRRNRYDKYRNGYMGHGRLDTTLGPYKQYDQTHHISQCNDCAKVPEKPKPKRTQVPNYGPVLPYVGLTISIPDVRGPDHNTYGMKVKTLIDTGCSKSTIDYNAYLDLMLKYNDNLHDMTKSDVKIMACNKQEQAIRGMVRLRIWTTEKTYQDTTAMVLDNLSEDFILGYDFLSSPVAHFDKDTVTIKNNVENGEDIKYTIHKERSEDLPCTCVRNSSVSLKAYTLNSTSELMPSYTGTHTDDQCQKSTKGQHPTPTVPENKNAYRKSWRNNNGQRYTKRHRPEKRAQQQESKKPYAEHVNEIHIHTGDQPDHQATSSNQRNRLKRMRKRHNKQISFLKNASKEYKDSTRAKHDPRYDTNCMTRNNMIQTNRQNRYHRTNSKEESYYALPRYDRPKHARSKHDHERKGFDNRQQKVSYSRNNHQESKNSITIRNGRANAKMTKTDLNHDPIDKKIKDYNDLVRQQSNAMLLKYQHEIEQQPLPILNIKVQSLNVKHFRQNTKYQSHKGLKAFQMLSSPTDTEGNDNMSSTRTNRVISPATMTGHNGQITLKQRINTGKQVYTYEKNRKYACKALTQDDKDNTQIESFEMLQSSSDLAGFGNINEPTDPNQDTEGTDSDPNTTAQGSDTDPFDESADVHNVHNISTDSSDDDQAQPNEQIQENNRLTGEIFTYTDVRTVSNAIADGMISLRQFAQAQDSDPFCNEIMEKFETLGRKFTILDGILFRKNKPQLKPVLPRSLFDCVIFTRHFTAFGSHCSMTRILRDTQKFYFVPSNEFKKRLRETTTNCYICQIYNNNIDQEKIRQLPKPKEPRISWSIDLITDTPKTEKGNTQILLCADDFSSYVVCIPLSVITADSVLEALMSRVFAQFGIPKIIRSDEQSIFYSSRLFYDTFKQLGIILQPTAVAAPQSNARAESQIKNIKHLMRKFLYQEHVTHKWDCYIHILAASHNKSVGIYGYSAEEIMFGNRVSSKIDILDFTNPHTNAEDYINKVMPQFEIKRQDALRRMDLKSQQNRTFKNKNNILKEFSVGTMVLHKQLQASTGTASKYKPIFIGPYTVLKINGDKCTAMLEHLKTRKIIKAHFTNMQLFTYTPKNHKLSDAFQEEISDFLEDKHTLKKYQKARERHPNTLGSSSSEGPSQEF